jgi:hypothetical protein
VRKRSAKREKGSVTAKECTLGERYLLSELLSSTLAIHAA